ncbi:bzip transcription factor [Stylonychia lemnae]|uniref:Bzip transcription factor n=1 Tax=Stylonychia lemnae TaxID=5949 RepID=A0A077ZQ12_STYLE|nr:bzip transcription factor [Stylonychia lemnae]|eukprot:CDW71993.1 bzip transcription factor [Stylonychia lemnae]
MQESQPTQKPIKKQPKQPSLLFLNQTLRKTSKSDKLVGKKRKASKQESSLSLNELASNGDDFDNESQNQKLFSKDNEFDSEFDDLSDDDSSTNNQLFKIEKKIQQPDLSKRERRLLQNRKSALKCRLKKQQELDKMKKQVDKLAQENRELKEKISGMNALLQCKSEENASLNKKYADLQLQQTLIIASHLTQTSGINGFQLGGRLNPNQQHASLNSSANQPQQQNQTNQNAQANNFLSSLMAQTLLSNSVIQQQQMHQQLGMTQSTQNNQNNNLQAILSELQSSLLGQQSQQSQLQHLLAQSQQAGFSGGSSVTGQSLVESQLKAASLFGNCHSSTNSTLSNKSSTAQFSHLQAIAQGSQSK